MYDLRGRVTLGDLSGTREVRDSRETRGNKQANVSIQHTGR